MVKEDPKTQAIISADKDVSHGEVIKLIDIIRQLGLFRFALNIDPAAALSVATSETETPAEQ